MHVHTTQIMSLRLLLSYEEEEDTCMSYEEEEEECQCELHCDQLLVSVVYGGGCMHVM
jgi:hypothetical protein